MAEESKVKPADAKLVDHTNDHDDVEVLRDVKVPDKFFKRISFGIPVLDEIFGGAEYPGLLPGSSLLFTGGPGAGKSTGVLQMMDGLQKTANLNILYNCGEEDKRIVKMRADRLGLEGNFGISHFDDVDKLISYCKKAGVEVLVQDSIQQLIDEGMDSESELKVLKQVGRKLHRYAHVSETVFIGIGQVTKGGDFAGPMKLKHDLDMHAHIRLNVDNMAREFFLTKNRFGPAGIPFECNLTQRGLDFAAAKKTEGKIDEDGEKAGTKASDRKDAIVKLIMEQLLNGEKISGYCFTRFKDPFKGTVPVEVSGNIWRTLVEVARKKLEAETHVFEEAIIDGRKHIFLGGM